MLNRPTLQEAANEALAEFDEYIVKELRLEPLISSEKAILNTFMVFQQRYQEAKKEEG